MDYKVNIFLKGMKNKQFFLAILIILTSMIFSVSAFIEEGTEYFLIMIILWHFYKVIMVTGRC